MRWGIRWGEEELTLTYTEAESRDYAYESFPDKGGKEEGKGVEKKKERDKSWSSEGEANQTRRGEECGKGRTRRRGEEGRGNHLRERGFWSGMRVRDREQRLAFGLWLGKNDTNWGLDPAWGLAMDRDFGV